ncbi:hypothetical protein [Microbispora sp. ATCC PTA-5024]|uniref:hypothetical protein n=1 Tax=Microbispora sp. ATCC PTA-5024 TaxID=316330 RepID=UPI0003DCAB18|nr:hypothetical protein [Microbispora sp. ATCC PTA-5024]ETK36105.1 hypothetical protein MPTA5024_10800 [Microbispora sp. ATCC PTA-5024]
MNAGTLTAMAAVNNGREWPCEIEIQQDVEYVRSERATKPDPGWEFIDAAGHFHAFAEGGELPTLNSERVEMPCDGSCGGVCEGEGYTVLRHTCRICGQEVEPGYVPDYEARTVGEPIFLRKMATVTITSAEPVTDSRDEVSVRVRYGDEELFGTGFVVNRAGSGGGLDGCRWRTTISARSLNPRLKNS